MKTPGTFAKTGIVVLFTAIAASLCCITPVLALIAGSAGLASTFSWLEPARPYLIGITVVVLGFAWYQKLKPAKMGDPRCACEGEEAVGQTAKKPSFWKGKLFLAVITAFAILMLAFPYYSKVFFPRETPKVVVTQSNNIQQAHLQISGMDCAACEQEIKHSVAQLPGFMDASVDYKTGNAIIKYDQSKTSPQQVDSAVNATGYKVVRHKIATNQFLSHDSTHR